MKTLQVGKHYKLILSYGIETFEVIEEKEDAYTIKKGEFYLHLMKDSVNELKIEIEWGGRMTRKNALYIIKYKRYLLDMLMRSSEEHIDLEVMTKAEFVKMNKSPEK